MTRLGPTSTRPELLATLSKLYDMPRVTQRAGDSADLTAALTSLERARPRRGQVIVVSDFLDDTDWRHAVARLAHAHDVLCVQVVDPRELVLPAAGMLTLVDTESGRDIHVQSNSASLRERYAAAAKERHDNIGRQIRDAGSEHLVLFTDSDWLIEIVRFVASRKTLRRHTSLSHQQRARRDPFEECSVSFEEPWRLAILVAPLALLVAYLVAQRARRKYALRFTSVDLLASVAPRRPGWQRHISAVLMLAALSALVFGFAKPSGTKKVRPRARHDHARDRHVRFDGGDRRRADAPRRGAGRGAAVRRRSAGGLEGRAAVVRHQRARAIVTPTSDHAPVLAGVDALTVGGGTATGVAINSALAAIAALPPGANGEKAPAAIVLMSDGSPTIGRGRSVAEDRRSPRRSPPRRRRQVPVDTIAFGTADGTVTIQGESVPVPADPEAMAAIASGSGGKSFTAKNGNELNAVYDQIRKVVGYDTVKTDLTEWFLGLALLLAVLTAGAALDVDAAHPVDARDWGMPSDPEQPFTLAFVGYTTEALADQAAAYEDAVLPLLADHGARVVYRGRRAPGRGRVAPVRGALVVVPRIGLRSPRTSPTTGAPQLLARFGEVFTVKQVVELDAIRAHSQLLSE